MPPVLRPLLSLVLLAAAPVGRSTPAAFAESRSSLETARLPLTFDMRIGHESSQVITCGSDTRDSSYAWCDGLVRNQCCRGIKEASEYVEGTDGTFMVAIDPPGVLCRVRITLGDPRHARGPVVVLVNDRVTGRPLSTAPGEFRTIEAETRARSGRIAVRFESNDCRGFAVRTIEINSVEPAGLGRLFPTPRLSSGSEPVPPAETLARQSTKSCRILLRRMCDFLVQRSPRQGGFSYHGAWYENAYPIRTLLAGSRILGESRYGERAFACLDDFVKCQGPGGNWLSAYFAPAGCDSVPADSSSSNLADIGTITTCLALAAPEANEARRALYLAAAVKYADDVSLPAQFEDGAFPNGRWDGQDFSHHYTVATATQGMSLAALFDATGDTRYLDAAERAARWLLRSTFRDDGRVCIYPHDRATPLIISPVYFGEMFYVADALIQVRHSTADDSLRADIDRSLDHWLTGPGGLASLTIHGYWWMPQDDWSSSKMGGMLFVLAKHPRLGQDGQIRQWLDNALAWMADPACSGRIGVMVHPASVGGSYALPATGFAGIGVAAALDPSALIAAPVPVVQRVGH